MDQIRSDDISEITRYVNDTKLKHKINSLWSGDRIKKKIGIQYNTQEYDTF